ncbi:hypothetical protein KC343_g10088 [Hortaea werneckii]|uniref:Uncharacterized protein n=1 Tax=Hortaea werneckii TaxID=91943 RepID=A0A3M7G3E4_HORWE|nr:hypothetical protein KC323_g2165 [Hortaea werneckii]KAI7169504.1 hypothetical protein KC352_g25215 [Hortaea werneckii]KAI7359639.1 hypothetical protein KC320_g288 [Hortaea werneckii]KAI7560522.1 hypothetical protein KC317_g9679 [Hortaea werneckii]KAI7596018.1 hypothetical protein KC346_g15305 [Hortaea werneckii]
MPPLLFVTARLSSDRINTFLSSHQSIRDVAYNSMLSLVRDQSTSVGDLKEATEPPIDDGQFQSGFIGSNDEDLWKHLARLTSEEADRPGAITIERDIMFALDDISNDKDTIAVLWKRTRGKREFYKWRVVSRFVPLVIADLLVQQSDEVDMVYIRCDVKDEDGTLDMKKVKEMIGEPWTYD